LDADVDADADAGSGGGGGKGRRGVVALSGEWACDDEVDEEEWARPLYVGCAREFGECGCGCDAEDNNEDGDEGDNDDEAEPDEVGGWGGVDAVNELRAKVEASGSDPGPVRGPFRCSWIFGPESDPIVSMLALLSLRFIVIFLSFGLPFLASRPSAGCCRCRGRGTKRPVECKVRASKEGKEQTGRGGGRDEAFSTSYSRAEQSRARGMAV
jgi:hypothetical protein